MGDKYKKVTRILIPVLLAVIMIFSGYKMITDWISERKASQSYTDLLENVSNGEQTKETQNTEEETPEIPKQYPQLDIDIEALQAMNVDFRGWLYFPALSVSYPIVQGEDNDFYLEHSFDGEDTVAGCIFMDYGAAGDWSDRNTFVFGHNMRDGSMFGSFKELISNPELLEENNHFYIYTEDIVYTYEVFALYRTKSTSDRFMTFTQDATYDEYVNWAVENSLIPSDSDLSARGNIVSLSTCYGSSGTTRRILLHGVLTAEEKR